MPQSTGAINSPTGSMVANLEYSDASVIVLLSGTYAGATMVFEGSRDGTIWYPVIASRRDALGSPATGFTADTNGVHEWIVGVKAFAMFRLRLTALSSGTLNIVMVSTNDLITYPQTITNPQQAVPNTFSLRSASGTNATSIKASAGTAYNLIVTNTNLLGARYIKLYNKASAPVAASDVPIIMLPISALGSWSFSWGTIGFRFTNGIALLTTTGSGDTDTGSVGAGDLYVALSYL